MRRSKEVVLLLATVIVGLGAACFATATCAQGVKHTLTPAEDVGLTLVYQYGSGGIPSGGSVIKYSPDHRYFAVVSERGNVETNKPEDVIWLFDISKIEDFVSHSGRGVPPAPVPLVKISSGKEGPFIHEVRWLPDSRGLLFTQHRKSARSSFSQLFLVDTRSRAVKALTPDDQDLANFDARSESDYVYTVNAPELLSHLENADAPTVLTGKNLWSILFPAEFNQRKLSPFPHAGLWLVENGVPHKVLDAKEKLPEEMRLSPDGRYLLETHSMEHPPAHWIKYQAPGWRIEYLGGDKIPPPTSTYYLLDLQTGSRKQLFDGAWGQDLGWWSGFFNSNWSQDGKAVLLGNVFLPLEGADSKEMAEREKHPYVAVLHVDTGKVEGLMPVGSGEGKRFLADGFFPDNKTVVLKFDENWMRPPYYVGPAFGLFREEANGAWGKDSETDDDPRLKELPIRIEKREGINQPPVIVATDKAKGNTYTVWDPNPQLKNIELGEAKVVTLKNLPGFYPEQEMGLVFPPGYIPGKRYPLVIQTHGFTHNQFLTSGTFTTGFAARGMAARGIIVAQVGSADDMGYENGVKSYDSVIQKLSDEGLIDPLRVGAIGFSSPVRSVIAHMAFGKHRLAAASVVDGVDGGYFQTILGINNDPETPLGNGGSPFRVEGLENWIKKCALFNTEKIQTPLLIMEPAPASVMQQWEEYATLYAQHKPVELVMLAPPDAHPHTNPQNRIFSETFTTDWFDFWLNRHEDPNPSKAEQYKRWRGLRELQEQNDKKRTVPVN